ncbi:hypothetical protein CEXT_151291 [Caerostris extrusa]|uniref:Uncharacterized protein n=1 Tax=Caerostris extrusa TaxID=172846 RepID=A0AAV4SAA8_CAEEX|nr:hypothetical protein CEXT_151291 [Caerostris extrusa]
MAQTNEMMGPLQTVPRKEAPLSQEGKRVRRKKERKWDGVSEGVALNVPSDAYKSETKSLLQKEKRPELGYTRLPQSVRRSNRGCYSRPRTVH